jgi:hypothetical protein
LLKHGEPIRRGKGVLFSQGTGGWAGLHCARRVVAIAIPITSMAWLIPNCTHLLVPLSSGRVPVLVQLRPSSEGLLRPRAPGAKDRHGRPSTSSRSASTGISLAAPFHSLQLLYPNGREVVAFTEDQQTRPIHPQGEIGTRSYSEDLDSVHDSARR